MMNRRRGLTLLECLVAVALFAVVALFTMRALGEGRIIRGNARAQETLLLLAQEELERVRQIPAGELNQGVSYYHGKHWPENTTSTLTMQHRTDGTWLVDVTIERDATEGLAPVRLATVRRGVR